MGCRPTQTPGLLWVGNIGAIIVIPSVIGSTARDAITAELADRFSITLP
jgi:hypothetical protein